MTLGPVDRSKFSKSTASRFYQTDGPCRLLPQSSEPMKLSGSAALLDNFETMGRGHFWRNAPNRGPGAGSRFPSCRSAVKLVVSAERRWVPCTTTGRQDAALVQLSGDSTGPAKPETANVGLHHRPRTSDHRCEVWCAHGRAHGSGAEEVSPLRDLIAWSSSSRGFSDLFEDGMAGLLWTFERQQGTH